jgi:hypothetical protein
VRAAVEQALARKAQPWRLAPEDFFSESKALRGLLARLVGGEPEGVALVPSVSYGMGVADANLHPRPGQRLLVLAGVPLQPLPLARAGPAHRFSALQK